MKDSSQRTDPWMSRGAGNLGARCDNHPNRDALYTVWSKEGYRLHVYCHECAEAQAIYKLMAPKEGEASGNS